MLRTILSRPPEEVDLTEMVSTAAGFRKIMQRKPEAAQQLIDIGESVSDATLDATDLAAWTMVANTLMNRDDFVSK